MSRTVAIIPARGGSKGIPRKNLAELCGKPLLAWSIEQARGARRIDSVWVSSDSPEILEVAVAYGAHPITRPAALSGNAVPSEAVWVHALEVIEAQEGPVAIVVGLQATSPIREPGDLDRAVEMFQAQGFDSLLSCCAIEDFFIWRDEGGRPVGVTYDYRERKPRQDIGPQYLENGSIYIFTPRLIRETGNRLGGRIGLFVMEKHKMFQVDKPEDLVLCRAVMRAYGLAP